MSWGVPKIGNLVEASSGNITLQEPAGIAQGDLMIACIAYRSNAAFSLPSGGWAHVTGSPQNSGDTDSTNGIASGLMAFVVRGASAPGLAFTRTGGDVAQGRIIAYSGGHATPFDTGSGNTLGSTSTTYTTGTITTAEANELIVALHSAGDHGADAANFDAVTDPATGSGTTTDTTTAPAAGTWLRRATDDTATGADNVLGIADAVRATNGATGTISSTGFSSRGVMIAGAFKLAGVAGAVLESSLSAAGTLVSALTTAIVLASSLLGTASL